MKGLNMNKIPVVFAIDKNYAPQLSAVVASILKNAKKDSYLEFNILCSGVPGDCLNKIQNLKKLNASCSFNFIDVTELSEKFNLSKYDTVECTNSYITQAAFYRLFIADIFKNYDKMLYLDVDIVVLKDLFDLYNTDLGNNLAAAVKLSWLVSQYQKNAYLKEGMTFRDYFDNVLKLDCKSYFNSGIMVFNLKQMREENTAQKFWEIFNGGTPFEYFDQDILNIVMSGRIRYIDKRWNCSLNDLSCFSPNIIHYLGISKPWKVSKTNQFWDYWWKYFKLTDFYTEEQKAVYQKLKRESKYYQITINGINIITLQITADSFVIKIFTIKTRIKRK